MLAVSPVASDDEDLHELDLSVFQSDIVVDEANRVISGTLYGIANPSQPDVVFGHVLFIDVEVDNEVYDFENNENLSLGCIAGIFVNNQMVSLIPIQATNPYSPGLHMLGIGIDGTEMPQDPYEIRVTFAISDESTMMSVYQKTYTLDLTFDDSNPTAMPM